MFKLDSVVKIERDKAYNEGKAEVLKKVQSLLSQHYEDHSVTDRHFSYTPFVSALTDYFSREAGN